MSVSSMPVVPQTRVSMAKGRSSDSSYKLLGLPEDFKALSIRLGFDSSGTIGNQKGTYSIG